MSFLKAHAKSITAFISAEAATFLTVLSTPHPGVKEFLIAALTPIAVGASVHQVTNTP